MMPFDAFEKGIGRPVRNTTSITSNLNVLSAEGVTPDAEKTYQEIISDMQNDQDLMNFTNEQLLLFAQTVLETLKRFFLRKIISRFC